MYVVVVDENEHPMNEDARRTHGTFTSQEAAVAAARALVDKSLLGHIVPGITAEQLYNAYLYSGDDPFIVARSVPDVQPPFSAWTYARQKAEELAKGA